MRLVERLFRQLAPLPALEDSGPRPLSAFWGEPALVVLGDPGAGKTTSFEISSKEEPNAEFVSVRDFLALSEDRWRGKTLYLDGLDEQRTRVEGHTVLDQLRGRLDDLGCPPFRLSCRAADWYGSSDIDRLRLVSTSGKVVVLRLEPLNDDNILALAAEVVPDALAFLHEAKQQDLGDLLTNPQTLLMILAVVKGGVWPRSRTELFNRACEILAREVNPEHVPRDQPALAMDVLFDAAGYLCAVLLCAGSRGIALTESAADDEYPFIGTLRGEPHVLGSAARRRLFRSDGLERVAPVHRTVAEYLAARYLKRRLSQGLPLRRVVALITGHDGGTLSELRGLYAWLACLSPDHAPSLVGRDPLAVVLYGDAAQLSPSVKRLVIESLGELARKDPWFRSENWASRPFGGLATEETEHLLRAILDDPNQNPVLVSCALDAIRYGYPLPALGDRLLELVRDPGRPDFLRADALRAFHHACPERKAELLTLLRDIHEGRVPDDERRLRAQLLRTFYPTDVSPREIAGYLVADHPRIIGGYTLFIDHELIAATPRASLPILADTLVKSGLPSTRDRRHMWARFLGRLLLTVLADYGATAEPARVYGWLGLVLDQHGHTILDEDHGAQLRLWLERHPSIVRAIFSCWLSLTQPDRLYYEWHLFSERLARVSLPEGCPQWLLDLAGMEPDPRRADFLFRESVRTLGNRSDAPTLEQLFAFVEVHSQFRDTLRSELAWEIPDWRLADSQHRSEHERRRQQARARRVQDLSPHLESIRSGSALNALAFLGKLYFGLFADVDHNQPPPERLRTETNDEIAATALQGFIALLYSPSTISPKAIGEAYARSRGYWIGYAILAGMDLLAARSQSQLAALPVDTLRGAIAFHYANATGQERPWIEFLIAERPDVVSEALDSFWRPQFARRSAHIPGIYDLDRQGTVAGLAQRVVLPLLRDYPTPSEDALLALLSAAIRSCDREELLRLALRICRGGRVRGAPRTLWLAAAFVLDPPALEQTLRAHVGKDRNKAKRLLDFLYPWPLGSSVSVLLQLHAIAGLLRIVAPLFSPRQFDEDERASGGASSIVQSLWSLVDRLSADPGSQATSALASLANHPHLAQWREKLAHAAAVQSRHRREAEFCYPTARQVIETVNMGQPTNAADLQALVTDHLRALADELRHGSTDGYKALWNVDSRGRPVKPRPEDDCRDRILEQLRPRLGRTGVIAEPEGHYAQDKRSDIKALSGRLNLPVEIKRHFHPALWRAPLDQLQRFYARDPGTGGRGIYLVFWFGIDFAPLPAPPSGISPPHSPTELEVALRQVIPEEDRTFVEMIVIDCSRPQGPR